MNLPQTENPDLTAYALGELDARQTSQLHGMLHISPSGAAELEEIEAVAYALSHHAPLPQHRLHHAQRQAVLQPVAVPRMMTPMQPRPMPTRRPTLWPLITSALKAAAVVTLACGTYWAGKNTAATHTSPTIADAGLPSAQPTVQPEAEPEIIIPRPIPPENDSSPPSPAAPALASTEVPLPSPETPERDSSERVLASTPATKQPAASALVTSEPPAKTIIAKLAPAISPPDREQKRPAVTKPATGTAFVSTTRQTVSQYAMRPSEIRPAPPRPAAGATFASPLPTQTAASKAATPAKTRPPELYIHSWKAEVAACPWNPSHRLLRVVIQLPADQPATTQPFTYPLEVAFDPNNVREYRQLCERHQPAEELRCAGTHSFWYEFLPNGKTEPGKTIASITLPQVRFTTQTVGPFDGSKLIVQDRGLDWQAAREDFIFDSAVVGFSMLLRGIGHSPHLNHKLVLSLAEKSLTSDSTGERQRFVKQVREAQKAAGL